MVQVTQRRPERMSRTANTPRSTNVAYSYLGGGVEWQPPSTYALVTRGMPLHIADRYFALLTFLARGSVQPEMFVRKQRAKHGQQLNKDDKNRSIEERVHKCRGYLTWLHRAFKTPQNLLRKSEMFSFDDEAYIDNTQKKKARR